MSSALRARWRETARAAGATDDAAIDRAGEDLLARWAEPHRGYHRTSHLEHCLRELDALADVVKDPTTLELAAWLHDAIYVARADADSEGQSAALADRALGALGVPSATIDRVRAIVLATRRHEKTGDPDGDLFLDVDLAILGAEEDAFDAYERGVRAEWSWVPDDAFAEGRAAFLRGMLARTAIYLTPRFRERLEGRARRNLERSLARQGRARG